MKDSSNSLPHGTLSLQVVGAKRQTAASVHEMEQVLSIPLVPLE